MNEASLQFHIAENDYFGTLATVLDLVRQDLDRRGYNPHAGTLPRLRDDLLHLHGSPPYRKGLGLRTPLAQKAGEPAVLTPSYCPLTVHDGPEREREADIKQTKKKMALTPQTMRKYW